MFLSLILIVLNLKSTPMVLRKFSLKVSSVNLEKMEDLPTAEFPTITNLNKWSQCLFFILFDYYYRDLIHLKLKHQPLINNTDKSRVEMETFDKITTSLCKPFEKYMFTPLYRLLSRKQPHEVSDDERKLLRLSQATILMGFPILLVTPISLYLNYRFYLENKKVIGNTEKYRRYATKSVLGLCIMTGMFIGMIAAYPKAVELKVQEIRKNELEEFIKGEEFKEVFKPQHLEKSKVSKEEGEEFVVKKIELTEETSLNYQKK